MDSLSDMIPIAIPAIVIVVMAAAFVRRERADRVLDLTEWDELDVVPVAVESGSKREQAPATGGALVEPRGSSLGARLRATEPEPPTARPRVRIRRRERPLVASRPES